MQSGADNYAVVGHPIAHSLSPDIHAQFAAQTGERLHYGRLDLTAEEFAAGCSDFFAGGGKGLNVTAPHKAAALALCAEASVGAHLADAVNTLSLTDEGLLRGDNTDGPGLVCDLRDALGVEIRGTRVLLIGAGGASRGVAKSLLDEGPASLTIANRTIQTAIDAAARFGRFGAVRGCGLDAVSGHDFDLIINATSLAGQAPALPLDIAAGAVCYDMAYAAGGTSFTAWALQHGARSAHSGIGMLIEQAALSFEIWRGVRPDTAAVRARLAQTRGFRP